MALTITDTVLRAAEEAATSADVAEAWSILSGAGDRYATNAFDIIAEINNPTTVFAKIVQVHWDRVAPDARQTVFMDVGLQHIRQYLEIVSNQRVGLNEHGEPQYLLPTSEQIEDSYRRAVIFHGLPAITAVDSLFSVMDWNLERSNEAQYVLARMAGVEDITWARMLSPELEGGRIVYDSEVFLNDNIEPYKETFKTMAALLQRAYEHGDASFVVAAVQLYALLIGTLGDVLPQMLGLEEPQAVALTAGLLLSIDGGMTEARMMRLLDALTLGDNNSAQDEIRDLEWLTRNLQQALTGTDPGPFGHDKEALFATANNLIASISADSTQNYELIDLTAVSAQTLLNVASQDNAQGRAYRYALVNLHPFALLQSNSGQPVYDALDESYDLDQFSEQYLQDRALFLNTLNTFYLTDASVNGDNLIEFKDEATDQFVMINAAGDHVSQRFFFGDDGADNFTGGTDDDHFYGGGGNDILSGAAGNDYLEGNAGADQLNGGVGDDELHGGAGNDGGAGLGLYGGAGDDALYGDAGNDTLGGGTERDLLVGGLGQDTLRGGDDHDFIIGGYHYLDEANHFFHIFDDGESDRLQGDEGDDIYWAGAGDIINDTDGKGMIYFNITLASGAQAYAQLGQFGIMRGGGGGSTDYYEYNEAYDYTIHYHYDDASHTLTVDDSLTIENFNTGDLCLIPGTTRMDFGWRYESYWWNVIDENGSTKAPEDYYASFDPWWVLEFDDNENPDMDFTDDNIVGTDGDDEIHSDAGDDLVVAVDGDGLVHGDSGNDELRGDSGDDWLYGDEGNDRLLGGEGVDRLFGGLGNDVLRGGPGNGDVLEGGRGNDTYFFGMGDGNTIINNFDNVLGRQDVPGLRESITPNCSKAYWREAA